MPIEINANNKIYSSVVLSSNFDEIYIQKDYRDEFKIVYDSLLVASKLMGRFINHVYYPADYEHVLKFRITVKNKLEEVAMRLTLTNSRERLLHSIVIRGSRISVNEKLNEFVNTESLNLEYSWDNGLYAFTNQSFIDALKLMQRVL